jgi:hypothetical protein
MLSVSLCSRVFDTSYSRKAAALGNHMVGKIKAAYKIVIFVVT